MHRVESRRHAELESERRAVSHLCMAPGGGEAMEEEGEGVRENRRRGLEGGGWRLGRRVSEGTGRWSQGNVT